MKTKQTVGIIGAMESEIEVFRAALSDTKTIQTAALTFYTGKIAEQNLVIVQSGIGKVNATRCTQILVDLFHPDYIINSGIAGGISSVLSVGDIVIGEELVQHDFDVTAFGHAKGYLCTGERDDLPTVFHSDERLVSLLEKSAKVFIETQKIHKGRIASGDIFISDKMLKQSISHEFGAIAVEMEGAAIAQTAAYAGIPFIVIRAISDCADGEAVESFETFEKQTAALSCAVIQNLINSL